MTNDIRKYINNASKKELEFLLYFYNQLEKIDNDPISIEIQFSKIEYMCQKNGFYDAEKYLLNLISQIKIINYDKQTKIIRILSFNYENFMKVLNTYKKNIEQKIRSDVVKINKESSKIFDEEELVAILKYMYDNAPNGYQMTMIHLFGIKYSDCLKEHKIKDISFKATGKDFLHVEISKGIKLAKYVKFKNK